MARKVHGKDVETNMRDKKGGGVQKGNTLPKKSVCFVSL